MKTVVISGLHYAITAALEQIVRAFRRLNDYTVISVGPYMGNVMPYKNGIIVSEKYDFKPDIIIPFTETVPIKFVEYKLKEIGVNEVHLWLDVDAGFNLSGDAKCGIRALFCTDPHTYLAEKYRRESVNYNFIFNPQRQYFLGVKNEYYLPYAAEAEWYRRLECVGKEYDVSLVGNIYAERVKYFEVISKFYKINHALGIGKFDAGVIYNKSRIGFSWSSMQDLVTRIFEIGLTGTVLLCNRVPDLEMHFIEGTDYIGFSNIQEAVEKTHEVLKNNDFYSKIGNNLREKVLKYHTWDIRLKQMLDIIKL